MHRFLQLTLILAWPAAVHSTLFGALTPDTCDPSLHNCRSAFSIVWGCLTTLFACTWVSVHPNVPSPHKGSFGKVWGRLKLMLVALIAPELIVGFAARQMLAARFFSRALGVSKTHGFFITMGGFVSGIGHHPLVTLGQLNPVVVDIKHVRKEEIQDKSKGDALAKMVAIGQLIWFTTQCTFRVLQHLPLTELEVATFAFASVDIFIWMLWWGKPLGVEEPIPIGPVSDLREEESTIPWLTKFIGVLLGSYGKNYNPQTSSSVPSYWSMDYDDSPHGDSTSFFVECITALLFGALHCIAWNAAFPTVWEMRLWRLSSLFVTFAPVVLLLFGFAVMLSLKHEKYTPVAFRLVLVFLILVPFYVVARLLLLGLPFAALRNLPSGAFIDVNWKKYMPNFVAKYN